MKHVLLYILFIVFYLPTTAQSVCGRDAFVRVSPLLDSIALSNRMINGYVYQIPNGSVLGGFYANSFFTDSLHATNFSYYLSNRTSQISYQYTHGFNFVNNSGVTTKFDTTMMSFLNFLSPSGTNNIPFFKVKDCIGVQSLPIYIPKVSNQYFGDISVQAKISNLVDTFDIDGNLINEHISTTDSFIYKSVESRLVIDARRICNDGIAYYPNCNYTLSFYIRPTITFNTAIQYNNNGVNYSEECLYAQKDIQFVDSFSLYVVEKPHGQISGHMLSPETKSLIPYGNNALTDTSNWHLIEHTFQVQDSARFLQIVPHANLDSVIYKYASQFNYQAYFDSLENHIPNKGYLGYFNIVYLFDSVSLVPLGYENLDLCLNDTSLCLSDSVVIDAYQADFIGYRWSTGDTTPSISISTPGTYTLYADYPCGTLCDDFIVYPSAPDSLLPYQDTISICPPQLPYTLQADSLSNYLWNTGDTTRQMIAQSSGLYTIESTFYCGIVRDSVYIKIKAKEDENLIAFTDTLVCAKALPFALEVIDTFQSYAWNNGVTTAQNTFAQADEYFVEVSDGCHLHQDTFRLQTEDLDTGIFVQQHFYCPQDFPINIDGFTFSEAKDTIFSQTQSNTCGSRTDSILLFVLPSALQEKPSINIIDSCKQLGYYLVNVLAKDTNFSYHWESGNPLQFTTKGGETQQLIISNACSTFKIDTFIAKCPEQIIFALPTAFSPNNDGVNDVFRLLYLNPDYELIELSIFNRWGSQIFSTDQVKTAWQGKFQNQNCPIDEYIYQLKLRHKTTSAVEVFSGSVLVVF